MSTPLSVFVFVSAIVNAFVAGESVAVESVAGESVAAEASSDAMSAAREQLYAGEAAAALSSVDLVLAGDLDGPQRIEAMVLRAYCLFMLQQFPQATAAWREVLQLEPGYTLDPVVTPPEFVEYFSQVAAEVAEPAPSASPAIEAIEALESPEPPEPPESSCGVALCLVPFGVGQFANGDVVTGIIFGALELAALATNVSLYWAQSELTPPEDGMLWTQRGALILFGVTTLAGIIQAFLAS